MQRAARKVAEENSRLRNLLASRGVARDEVDAYLRSFDDGMVAPPIHPGHALPVQRRPEQAELRNGAVQHDMGLRMQPATRPLAPIYAQPTAPTPIQPVAPSSTPPPAQPDMNFQRTNSSIVGTLQRRPCGVQEDAATNMDPAHEPRMPVASKDSSCCRPADSNAQEHNIPTFSMAEDDADCPSTANCFCPPTSAPKERPLDTGLLISCETAATIIAEMRGDGDRNRIRASLGCHGDTDCNVKNTLVLELMDER